MAARVPCGGKAGSDAGRGAAALLLGCALALAGCETVAPAGSPGPSAEAPVPAAPTPVVPDSDLADRIVHQWKAQAPGLADTVQVAVTAGRAVLTGRVAGPERRVEAVRLAWQVDGLKEVSNEIQVDDETSLTDRATDAWITGQLRSKLLLDGGVRSLNYTIDTVNQVVYLMGQAGSQAELDRVLAHARALPRVKRVVNHVRL